MIFQGMELNPAYLAHKIRSACDGIETSSKEKPTKNLREPNIDYEQEAHYSSH
jgi:hypothetical protein